jgi:16S rRNA G966 N2-methylase RsmD
MQHAKKYDSNDDSYHREPYASDVRAGKNSPIYNAHSYHTKVPPEGIEPFIKHYTEPGDLILDPFCGSGMTGVAALKLARIPILIDLCPSATFIAYNYCTPLDVNKFDAEAKRILDKVREEMEWLYETRCRKCGGKAIIEYTIWSDEFQCPRCSEQFLLWNVAVTRDGKVKREFECPNCKKELRKQDCKRTTSKPVRVNYTCLRCKRREDEVSEFDLEKIREIERRWKRIYEENQAPDTSDGFWPIQENGEPLWFPDYRMPEGDESRRNDKIGITHVHHFYTTRNLWALARLWDEIGRIEDERIEKVLQFAFTNTCWHGTLMRRFNARGGDRPLSGTLYIPSIPMEANMISVLSHKFRQLNSAYSQLNTFIITNHDHYISTQSATNMANIPSNTIDYVFTDPPFGGNLMYSELNFLWEAWLGQFTDNKEEAIINETQGKGLQEYKELMTKCFKEIYRVLKPGRWMTMVFHNSDGKVWQAIQDGLAEAGFVIGMIGTFDKQQRSFKQVTSTGAVGYDVVVNCYKPKATVKNGITGKTTYEAIVGYIADRLRELPLEPSDERTDRMLHSKTIGFFMQQSNSLERLSFEEFKKILAKNFREIDGYWYLPYQRPRLKQQKLWIGFGFITTEVEAIEWLEELLKIPKTYGDIAHKFFIALGDNKLKKDLKQLLEENFILEKGRWRNPTQAERERLLKLSTDKTAREIKHYLNGELERSIEEREICEWIEFCYKNEMYNEGVDLFKRLAEGSVEPEIYKKTKKIAEVCKIKIMG